MWPTLEFVTGLVGDGVGFWSNQCIRVCDGGESRNAAQWSFMVPGGGCGQRAAGSVLGICLIGGAILNCSLWAMGDITIMLVMGRAETGPGLVHWLCRG